MIINCLSLITAAEEYKNVELYFNHKLIEADLEEGTLKFLQ